jgi:hypothetical protein
MERPREGGKGWHWSRSQTLEMAKVRPVSPWVNPMAQVSCSLVLGGVLMIWTTSTYRPRVSTLPG